MRFFDNYGEEVMKVAFIGLGIMGSRMAKNLLKNGVKLTVYNRDSTKMKPFIELGAATASTARECVRDADVVFTMLSTPEVVRKVAFNDKTGFVEAMKPGAVWVDSTTVNPSFSQQCHEKSAKFGINFVDAPVAGSLQPAENAELVFLVGASNENLQKISPLLSYMGKKTIHAGTLGMGASLKMLVNMMLGESMLIFAETAKLGQALGFSEDFLLDTLPAFPVIAPFVKAKAERIKSGNYEAEFPLEWIQKDLHLASLSAYENESAIPYANLAKEIFAAAKAEGMHREDFSAIYKFLNKKHVK